MNGEAETKARISKIIRDNPTLCDHGFDRKPHEDAEISLLLGQWKEFDDCCKILRAIPKSKRENSKHSSYGLKHELEKRIDRYVSNGTAICALIECGFDVKSQGMKNPGFNMYEADYAAILGNQTRTRF